MQGIEQIVGCKVRQSVHRLEVSAVTGLVEILETIESYEEISLLIEQTQCDKGNHNHSNIMRYSHILKPKEGVLFAIHFAPRISRDHTSNEIYNRPIINSINNLHH